MKKQETSVQTGKIIYNKCWTLLRQTNTCTLPCTWYCILAVSWQIVALLFLLWRRLWLSFTHWTPEKRDADGPWMGVFQGPTLSWFSPPGFWKKTSTGAEILEYLWGTGTKNSPLCFDIYWWRVMRKFVSLRDILSCTMPCRHFGAWVACRC